MSKRLFYVHDPMCSWCWAFRPVLIQLTERLPPDVKLVKLLGGLAPDSNTPMPLEMRRHLQATWKRIQHKLPTTEFNFDFWSQCEPKRSTWPACRAVIAARNEGDEYADKMTLAIQEAYYLKAENPSELQTLVTLASRIGLDKKRFEQVINSREISLQLQIDINQSRSMGATSFPSLVLQEEQSHWPVVVDYHSVEPILESINGNTNSTFSHVPDTT